MDISLKDLKIQNGAGERLFYDFKTNKIISFKEDTGTITDAKLSKNAEEGIKTAFRDTLYKTADTTFTTESGFRDLKKLAASEGGRASRKADEAWTKAEEFSKQVSIDYAPYLINTMVDKYLGDRTPENYQKAFEMIRDAVARGETDKLMSDLGINFIDPKQVENKINTGKQGIEQKLVDIRKEVEPFIKNPSGDPKAVPIAVNPEFIESPNYEKFREKLSTFDKSFTDIRDAQEFVRHNPWLLGTLEKLRESGVNPEVIAPNLYKAYKTINTPITSPGKLPKTETQTLKMDGPGLESRLDNVLGLPEGKYKIFGK